MADSCVVWWAQPRPVSPATLRLLSAAERERMAEIRRPPDRDRFATGRLLARAIIARRQETTPDAVVLDATCPRCGRQHGKVTSPGVELSISHSGDRVAVAVTRSAAVGVDVESGDALGGGDGSALWTQVLAPHERDAIAALPPGRRRDALLIVWTRKEALLKASGDGIGVAMTALEVTPAGDPPRLLAGDGRLADPGAVTLRELHPGDGYHGAVAVLAPEPLELAERPGDELLDALDAAA